MLVGVPRETFPNERRVALTPQAVATLVSAGLEVVIESGAGEEAGLPDQLYQEKGAKGGSRGDTLGADVVLVVRAAGAAGEVGRSDLSSFRSGQGVIGFANPLG